MRVFKRLFFIALVFTLGISFSSYGWLSRTVFAQNHLDIEGAVVDQHGDPIVNAQVVLTDHLGLLNKKTQSGDDGRFRFLGLEFGSYDIFVTASGFQQSEKKRLDLNSFSRVSSLIVEMKVSVLTDSVVITPTRNEISNQKIGTTTTVITSDDLENPRAKSVIDVLRTVPGLMVIQTGRMGGTASIFSRGGESDYNKVLIDGIPVNDPGGTFDFSLLTLDNLDRIEVVRGPQSAIYGSDAMASTIQLITRKGTTSFPEFQILSEGGSFGSMREAGRISGAFGSLDYSSSFSYQRTKGVDLNDDFQNRAVSSRFGLQLNKKTDLNFTLRGENSSYGVIGPSAILFSDPDQRQNFRTVAMGGSLQNTTTSFWNQHVSFVFSENNRYSFDPVAQDLTNSLRRPLGPGEFGSDFAFQFLSHQKRHGIHYRSDFTIPGRNLISIGTDLEREAGNIDGIRPLRNNLGSFIHGQFYLYDRLSMQGGVRIEYNKVDVPKDLLNTLRSIGSALPNGKVGFGKSINPRLSLVYTLFKSNESLFSRTRLRFNAGKGIKEPTLVEAFSPNPYFIGNPVLSPEKVVSFEVGVDQYLLDSRLQMGVVYFQNRFTDLITYGFDPLTYGPLRLPNGQLTHFKNTDRANSKGIELTVRTHPVRSIQLNGNYTFLTTRIDHVEPVFDFVTGSFKTDPELGLSLLRRPRHSGSLSFGWQTKKHDLDVEGLFVGQRRDIDPVSGSRFGVSNEPIFAKSSARLNLSSSYKISSKLTMFASMRNILNSHYEEVLGFPAYRANFSAGLCLNVGGRK